MIRKGLLRFSGFLVLMFVMAGCFEVSTVVSVKPDGSGTVAERMLMSRASFGQMQGLSDGDKKGKPGQPPDKAELEKKSREYGEGVRFLKVRPVITKTHEGYEALYAFRDINLLQISRKPDTGSSADSASAKEARKKNKQYVRFNLQKGSPASPARLVIMMDQDPEAVSSGSSSPGAPPANPEQQQMMANVMKEFFRGMRVFMAVDIDGSILSSNAMHRQGKRITLMDVNFDMLLADPKKFASFSALGTEPPADAMQKIMEKIPGIKIEVKKEVDVTFQ